MLSSKNFPGPITIERAHRIRKIREEINVLPRVVIITFLNYTDKACVMKIARLKAPVFCDNQGLLFSPDVSAKSLKQRKIFDPVKKKDGFPLSS